MNKTGKTVLTIGTFDGVHEGHKVILRQVVEQAESTGGSSVVVTFDPHPRSVLMPEKEVALLTSLQKKLSLLKAVGIDEPIVVPFNKAFSELDAETYVVDFLVKKFHPNTIVVGYDHRFGHGRSGDMQLLKMYGAKHGFEVIEIPAQVIDDATISSTKIRNALLSGDMETANAMLGRMFSITGKVVKGKQNGRTIGFPTANLVPEEALQLVPQNGVYAAKVSFNEKEYVAMVNIGLRPTVSNDGKQTIEAHLLNFSEDIYDQEIEIHFIQKMREEIKFDGLEALKSQLEMDRLEVILLMES